MAKKAIYSGALGLSKRLTFWERRVWLFMLFIFVATSGFWLFAKLFPELAQTNTGVTTATNWIFAGVGLFQAVSLTLVVALPLIRGIFTSNPAETLAVDFLKRAYPALLGDIAAIIHRDEIRFSNDFLKITQSSTDLDAVSQMNAECFQSSAHFGGSLEEKIARNNSIFEKNKACFAQVLNEQETTIGLSIVIPLNIESGKIYKSGRLSDLDISHIHIAKPGEPCECLLLFAIGLKPKFNVRGSAPQYSRNIRQIIRCHVLHAALISKDYEASKIQLIAQVEKPSIKKFLLRFGMRRLPHKGLDGDPLFGISWEELKKSIPSELAS